MHNRTKHKIIAVDSVVVKTQKCVAHMGFMLTHPRRCFVRGSFFFIIYAICLSFYAAVYGPRSLVIRCWERDDFLAILCVVFSCVFVTFPSC